LAALVVAACQMQSLKERTRYTDGITSHNGHCVLVALSDAGIV
jgi:hypothetical protein